MKNKKKLLIFCTPVIYLVLTLPQILAHCPLCTAAAGFGIGITRWAGIDDSIVGLFLGSFIASTGLWFNNLIKKKKVKLPLQGFLLVFASFLATTIPLYVTGIIKNTAVVRSLPELSMLGFGALGIDKLFFGAIIGTIAISSSFALSDYIKKVNGKVLFHYQGIAFMLIVLFTLSEIFWIITK